MTGSLDDVKRRILTRVPLADLIGESVTLTNRSGRPVGCCPFHNEKTPSFYIYDDRYHCFGCKENGNAIDYVIKTQALKYVEALRFLSEKYGIEAPELEQSSTELSRRKRTTSLYELMLAAQEYFGSCLATPEGAAARNYLLARGFTADSIKSFGFGVTPKESFGLVRHLRSRGFKEADMHECSLAAQSTKDHRYFDFFKSRVMLPIHDAQGRIIAFGGRTLEGHPAKYMNSRDTSLFDKSRTLFGFDKARKVMRERGRAIVVEGYMDACMLWQQGFPESVACLGTAFTEHHLKLIRQATAVVVLLFDGDKAGHKATLDTVSIALGVPDVHIKAVRLPPGKDPDDFLREGGADALEALVAKAEDLLDFAVREKLRETHRLGIPELLQKELIPWLAKTPDHIQRAFLTSRLSHLTGLSAQEISSEVGRALRAANQQTSRLSPTFQQGQERSGALASLRKQERTAKPLDSVSFALLGHVYWGQPAEIDATKLRSFAERDLELAPDYLQFLDDMLETMQNQQSPAKADGVLWSSTLSPLIAPLIDQLRKNEAAFACSDRQERIAKLLAETRRQRMKGTISTLRSQLVRASTQPGQEDEVRRLLQSINDLNRELNTPEPA